MHGLPVRVRQMTEAAGGTTSRRDLLALGYSSATIDRWEAAGLFESCGFGELRLSGSERSVWQALRIVLNRAGPGARLGGAGYHSARVRVGFDDARRKGLVTEAEPADHAVALGRAHGAPQTRAIIRTGKLRMESEPARHLFDVFEPGDPLPAAQVWVCWHGRYYRLDFAYLEARMDLEYDGDGHESRREQDADRDLAIAELEIHPLRITKSMMRDPAGTRRRILTVRQQRLALGLSPIVPDPPPWAR